MSFGRNKFVISLAAAVIVLSGGLGFLVTSQSQKLNELKEEYGNQVNELQRLQQLKLYPDQANLEKLQERKELAEKSIADLRGRLSVMSFPLEAITPEQFQDKLRATVSALGSKSKEAGVLLPERFYLGFDKYQSEPPKTEAAAALNRQLKAMEWVFKTLIENRVTAVTMVDRAPLPQEGGAENASLAVARATPPKPAKPSGNNKANQPEAAPLFQKFPFDIQFTSEQRAFQQVLNRISKADQQIFVVSRLNVKNERETPLSKSDPSLLPPPPPEAALPVADAPAAPAPPAVPDQLRYIVGTEKVIVSMRLEMVVFSAPPTK